ncbi:MAG: hypothetical protein JNM39_10920 [Bdellovibrionaceae bacterium]|nr:hypothetical protein [Pseudobdellovibrionaceae bacterium]
MFQRTISAKKAGNLITEYSLKLFFAAILALTNLSGFRLHADQGTGTNLLALALPWSSIQSNLQGILEQEAATKKTFKIPSRTFSIDGIDLMLGEIIAELSGEASSLIVNKAGFHVVGETLQLDARIGGVEIDQVLERSFDGHRVNIRIQAHCEPFSLQVRQGYVKSQYSWKTTNLGLQIQADLFQLNFQPDSISISDLNCFGLEGLATEIKTGLFASLKNPEKLQKILSAEIEKKMNSLMAEKWALYQVGNQYQVQEHGLLIYRASGLLLEFDPEIFSFRIGEINQGPQVVLTEKNLNQLALQQIKQFSQQKINVGDLPDFQRLLRSRFLQFFVWPDLMNFSKSAKFEAETSFIEKLTLTKSGQGYELTGVVNSTLRGERNRILRDYLRLTSQMSARVDSQILEGQLLLDIHNSQSQMSWKFFDDYKKEFSPSARISGTIQKKLNEAITRSRRISTVLPRMDIGGSQWKIKSVNHRGNFAEFAVAPWQK